MRDGQGPQRFGRVAPAQDGAGAGAQFPYPQLLGMVVGQVEILAGAPAALGVTQQCPTAGLVAGAAKLLPIDKTSRHPNRVPVEVGPILAEPLQARLEEAAGQVGHMPVLYDQEAAAIGNERESALLLRSAPADPGFAGLQVIGGSAPGQQADPLALILGHRAHRLAH